METSVNLSTEKAQRDYQLVLRARDEGDERAYADLMRTYREPLYMMLFKMTSDATAAEDLTIEAFGKAFHQLKNYTPNHAFSTWLFAIASNNCIDYLRRKRKEQTYYIDDVIAPSYDESQPVSRELNIPSEANNPEEDMVRQQRIQVMREVIKQLKPMYRYIVELRYFEELSYEEIAAKMNMPIGSVKSKLHRAHNLLFSILSKRDDIF
ncbi:MAG: sigma-70 family RNA polymerase sigma factor [Bacteroidales bacterium]|nr:sigma-70 family RNA polymerase sigma factor [Bacteroidales bacterium]